jgi:hypothetical protein
MLPATSLVHYTTSCNTKSSAPEDGQNNCPKHVELTGIINKQLLLHLVGCLYYLYQWCTVKQISHNEIYLLVKYIKSVLWRVAKRLSYTEDARCLKVKRIFSIKILLCSSPFFPPLRHQRHPPHHKIRKRNMQGSSNYSIVCRGLTGCIPTHRASVMAPCLPSASPLLLWLTLVTQRAARSSQAHKSTLSFSTHGCQHQSLPSPQYGRIILLWWLFTHKL